MDKTKNDEIINKEELFKDYPVIKDMAEGKEVVWINPNKTGFEEAKKSLTVTMDEVIDAEKRLDRFAPFIRKVFPETEEAKGIIESPLVEIPMMKDKLNKKYNAELKGRLLLKEDSHLPIAGSIKARGGIYEILKYTEELAFKHGLLTINDSYDKLADTDIKSFFKDYTIQVGSTGNLGLSIGIISAVVGYKVIVHMSADARQWKKDLLRSYGVTVIEYDSDYSVAVEEGRKQSDLDPKSYFVDDENSKNLFMGYAVAAIRLKKQLGTLGIAVDESNPLFVYLPCGVGGAPGGVAYGLKELFGDNVHPFFVEPVNSPCMALGMASGLDNKISVQDIGLTGLTHADGLAVGRASGFVGSVMKNLLSGVITLNDPKIYEYMRDLLESEDIFIEPSACAAFQGPVKIMTDNNSIDYLKKEDLMSKMDNSIHIAWATGGKLVPQKIREEYIETHLE